MLNKEIGRERKRMEIELERKCNEENKRSCLHQIQCLGLLRKKKMNDVEDVVYVWYHCRYVRLTAIHCDFPKATLCNFCKITVSQNIGVLRGKHRSRETLGFVLFGGSELKL
jgi:hypothetical protein